MEGFKGKPNVEPHYSLSKAALKSTWFWAESHCLFHRFFSWIVLINRIIIFQKLKVPNAWQGDGYSYVIYMGQVTTARLSCYLVWYQLIVWCGCQASLTPSWCPWPHRAVAADQPQWILLKANNGQQNSDGCADFYAWLESDLVLIINFNSTHK